MAADSTVEETPVVTVFLRHDGDVLLLRRSDAVGSDSGKWGAVAGPVASERRGTGAGTPSRDDDGTPERDPETAARAEIREETGLDPARKTTLVRAGDPFTVADADLETRWLVHPFLFEAATRSIETNEETAEFEWVPPTEILRRDTVPDLWTAYDRVRPTIETVASDREHGASTLSIRALTVLRDEAAVAVERGEGDWSALVETARALRTVRPSMPVVANRVNRMLAATTEEQTPGAVEAAAAAELDRAREADGRAAARLAERLPDRVATLSRSGTVLTTLSRADPSCVLVAESRPGREGVVTAERVADATDAKVTLTTDAAFAEQVAGQQVEALVVGADAILPDGSVVNKVGTRAAATLATHDGVDSYAVAASDKILRAGSDGFDPEERDPAGVYDGNAAVAVANPTFGVTAADRFDAVVTEQGVLDAGDVREIAGQHRDLAAWDE